MSNLSAREGSKPRVIWSTPGPSDSFYLRRRFDGCVASESCSHPIIDEAPVPLCGKHVREVYQWAADYVTERWDAAVREYVAGLHDTFRPPRAVKAPKPGNVYFIRFGDRVKVGFSTDPDRRLKDLPYDEIIGIIPGTRDDEAAWHRALADFRVTGEWFEADPEVVATLRGVVQAQQTA